MINLVPVCPFCKRVHCICGSGPGRPPFAPTDAEARADAVRILAARNVA